MRRIFFLCIISLLMSCGDTDESTTAEGIEVIDTEFDDEPIAANCEAVGQGEDCLEVARGALRVDDEERLGIEEMRFDREKKSILMRLAPGAELPSGIEVDKVIYRARRDRKPFAAIIKSIDRRDNEVRIQVENAPLKRVFKRGRIRKRIPVEFERLEVVPRESEMGPTMGALRRYQQGLEFGVQDCTGTLYDQQITGLAAGVAQATQVNVDVQLNLTQCKAVVSGWVDANMVWGGVSPDSFEFVLGGGIETALAAEAIINAPEAVVIGDETKLATLGKIVLPFGGFNVTITPEIYAGFDAYLEGGLDAEAGFQYDASLEAGFGWTAGNGFYDIWNPQSSFSPVGPTLNYDGISIVTAYIKPKLNVKLYDVVGGSASIKAYVRLHAAGTAAYENGAVTGKVCYDLDAGLQPIVGAELSALGVDLVDVEWALSPLETTLADACIDGDVLVETCGATDECVADADCLPDNATACTVAKCNPNTCTCNIFDTPCCTEAADCDDGDPSTTDICLKAFGSCQHTPTMGYCNNVDDCDDGSLQTIDRCVDNTCEFENQLARNATEAECQTHADCDDGDDLTTDSCVVGSCRNSIGAGATVSGGPLGSCENTCNDNDPITEDICDENGECTHEKKVFARPPGM